MTEQRRTLDPRFVAAARMWAAFRFPYLAVALFAAPVLVKPDSGTVGADESWRIYIDPALIEGWTVPQLGSVFVHLSGHLLREHADRARARGLTSEHTQNWLDAVDAEIDDDFLAYIDLPTPPVLGEHLGLERGRLAEEYFNASLNAGGEHAHGFRDCGSVAHGQPRSWEQGDGKGLGEGQRELLRRQVASEVVRYGREHGDLPLGLERWASSLLNPKVDWRRALAAELRAGVQHVVGAVDYSYRRPSRRAGVSPDVVLPALRKPVPEVAVVCDTSGSMNDDLLASVLAEVDGLLNGVGVRTGGVRVLACDTNVHTVQRVSSARQVELFGGGGTDMGAGIEAAVALRPRPQVVVVLTDGYTPWPNQPPKNTRVIVGLLGERAPDAPTWARVVRVDELV